MAKRPPKKYSDEDPPPPPEDEREDGRQEAPKDSRKTAAPPREAEVAHDNQGLLEDLGTSQGLTLLEGQKLTETAQAGVAAAIAREGEELKARIVAAKIAPRNPDTAAERIVQALRRPADAEAGTYAFRRGKKKILREEPPGSGTFVEEWIPNIISGLSINAARLALGFWGNADADLRIVSIDADYVHVRGVCMDLETNVRFAFEDKFQRLQQRKVWNPATRRKDRTEWVEPDERDLRELTNKRGAIALRNAILGLLPAGLKAAMENQIKITAKLKARGKLEADRPGTLRELELGFSGLGVDRPTLETYLESQKHAKWDDMDEETYVELRGVLGGILTGQTKREEVFAPPGDQVPEADPPSRDRKSVV